MATKRKNQKIDFDATEKYDIISRMNTTNALIAKIIDLSGIKDLRAFDVVKHIVENGSKVSLGKVSFSEETVERIKAERKEFDTFLPYYNPLIMNLSGKYLRYSKAASVFNIDFDDFVSEGQKTLYNAYWNFRGEEASFITYFCTGCEHALGRLIEKNSGKKWNNTKKALFGEYSKAKRNNPMMDFDTLAKEMELTEDEVETLKSLLVKVKHHSAFEKKSGEKTELLHLVDHRAAQPHESDEVEMLRKAVGEVLTDVEKQVYNFFIIHNGQHGWMTEASKSVVNPESNKKYTKPSIKNIFVRLQRKLQEKLVA